MGAAGGPGGRTGAGLPRAVSYLRVSTGGQVDSTSIDTQREQCRALARAHGLVLVGEYLDAGVSGAVASRPGLDELLAAAAAGEVEVVLVAKLDRLGRSLLHLLGLIEHLNALGLRVISASDMIDTKTPAGRMMLGLLGAFAEFERERLRERSVDGAYRRVLAGGFVGSSPPFGYRPVPDPSGTAGVVLDIDPTQAACIRAMYPAARARPGPADAGDQGPELRGAPLGQRQAVDHGHAVSVGPRRRTDHRGRGVALARPAGRDPADPHRRRARRLDGLETRHRQTRAPPQRLSARRPSPHAVRALLPRPHRRARQPGLRVPAPQKDSCRRPGPVRLPVHPSPDTR